MEGGGGQGGQSFSNTSRSLMNNVAIAREERGWVGMGIKCHCEESKETMMRAAKERGGGRRTGKKHLKSRTAFI